MTNPKLTKAQYVNQFFLIILSFSFMETQSPHYQNFRRKSATSLQIRQTIIFLANKYISAKDSVKIKNKRKSYLKYVFLLLKH